MRVVILHMRYRPDATGTGPLVTELAESLAAHGDRVTVITSVPHYGRRVAAGGRSGLLFRRANERGVDVWRARAFPWGQRTVIGRSIDYGLYTLLSAIGGLLAPSSDVVLAVSPPITIGLAGWLVASLRRRPLVFGAQDIWPDGLIQMGRLRNRLLIRILHGLERWLYRRVDRVVVLSAGMKANLEAKGVPEATVEVIPNWVDTEVIRPAERTTEFRSQLQLTGSFVALFAGNLGYAAGLETVIEAARQLKDQPRIRILIVGEGSARPGLVARARSLGVDNVRFLPTQPGDRLNELLASADLSLVTLRAGMGRVSVPSKTLAIMASGRPVLAAVPPDSEVVRILERSGCGRAIPPENPQALAAALRELSNQPEALARMGNNGREHVVEHFGREAILPRYRTLLVELTGGSSDPPSELPTAGGEGG